MKSCTPFMSCIGRVDDVVDTSNAVYELNKQIKTLDVKCKGLRYREKKLYGEARQLCLNNDRPMAESKLKLRKHLIKTRTTLIGILYNLEQLRIDMDNAVTTEITLSILKRSNEMFSKTMKKIDFDTVDSIMIDCEENQEHLNSVQDALGLQDIDIDSEFEQLENDIANEIVLPKIDDVKPLKNKVVNVLIAE
ncbi:SNF7 family protein [Flavobacteriaceae bacterium]|nr:SNF7 family protein [Flavobacteriaceae bacterium]